MRIFKTKWFARYAKRERITDSMLCEAIDRAERGIIDADLGGHVIKQRVAREGQSRSKGYRVLIAYRINKLSFFMYGFAKSERDNVGDEELESLKEIASAWINADNKKLRQSLDNGSLVEVNYDKKI